MPAKNELRENYINGSITSMQMYESHKQWAHEIYIEDPDYRCSYDEFVNMMETAIYKQNNPNWKGFKEGDLVKFSLLSDGDNILFEPYKGLGVITQISGNRFQNDGTPSVQVLWYKSPFTIRRNKTKYLREAYAEHFETFKNLEKLS